MSTSHIADRATERVSSATRRSRRRTRSGCCSSTTRSSCAKACGRSSSSSRDSRSSRQAASLAEAIALDVRPDVVVTDLSCPTRRATPWSRARAAASPRAAIFVLIDARASRLPTTSSPAGRAASTATSRRPRRPTEFLVGTAHGRPRRSVRAVVAARRGRDDRSRRSGRTPSARATSGRRRRLVDRQRSSEVLRYLVLGHTNAEIAALCARQPADGRGAPGPGAAEARRAHARRARPRRADIAATSTSSGRDAERPSALVGCAAARRGTDSAAGCVGDGIGSNCTPACAARPAIQVRTTMPRELHRRTRQLEIERDAACPPASAPVVRIAQPDADRSTTSVSNSTSPTFDVLIVTVARRSTRRRGARRRSVSSDASRRTMRMSEPLAASTCALPADEAVTLADQQRHRVALAEPAVDDRPTPQPDQAVADVGDLRAPDVAVRRLDADHRRHGRAICRRTRSRRLSAEPQPPSFENIGIPGRDPTADEPRDAFHRPPSDRRARCDLRLRTRPRERPAVKRSGRDGRCRGMALAPLSLPPTVHRGGRRVLFADDDAGMRAIVLLNLQAEGFEVTDGRGRRRRAARGRAAPARPDRARRDDAGPRRLRGAARAQGAAPTPR